MLYEVLCAKPTGHVPQLFYDAWHDCKIGRFESRFLRLIEILPAVEPLGPITGPQVGLDQYSGDPYGHGWVSQSTCRGLYQKPRRSPRRSYRGRLRSAPKKIKTRTRIPTDVKTTSSNWSRPSLSRVVILSMTPEQHVERVLGSMEAVTGLITFLRNST